MFAEIGAAIDSLGSFIIVAYAFVGLGCHVTLVICERRVISRTNGVMSHGWLR